MTYSFLKSIARLSVAVTALGIMTIAFPVAAETCGSTILVPAVDGTVFLDYDHVNVLNFVNPPVRSRGVVYATEPAATVSAPADGIVEYSGFIENLGHVVILNIGGGYRVVLAGLATISVRQHQLVESHSEIGVMLTSETQTPHLYLELRCGETPVNPHLSETLAMQ